VYAHDGDDDAEGKVEGYKELIESASRTSEERVEETSKSYCERIHYCRGPDEDPLPKIGSGIFPVFEASFGP